ncbi:hypothetical protein CBR_g4362 [Chara braunii]|uniref:SUMO-activating enzyme subunit n=1 Tax=Chara braunii TaxID=69332 RepID=A0A388KHM3_CHABU|nr:hypothetical protein CBR_g4362 [Chara braunii]|eukprot:GBG69526.1 hypothetical protein CBR_g4362 [Chara braunii]
MHVPSQVYRGDRHVAIAGLRASPQHLFQGKWVTGKCMAAMDPRVQLQKAQDAKVLMVGAGGIGCELLKTLVLTGFRHIELIDMDTIEISNLNRQFLFRQRHVGKPKAEVAREAALKLRPDAKIVAHHANVKDPKFNLDFFGKFSVVMNGLDNLEARRHVNRMCLAANVPLVESGTTGYLGQVTVHIKGKSECYECKAKAMPKSYPTCTITNTPSKPVHCIVWAKELPFAKLFGERGVANDLDIRVMAEGGGAGEDARSEGHETEEKYSYEWCKESETSRAFARRIFDRIFGFNVMKTLEMDDLWKNRRRPTPLYVKDVWAGAGEDDECRGDPDDTAEPDVEICGAERGAKRQRVDESGASVNHTERDSMAAGPWERGLSAAASLGLMDLQKVWSLKENTRVFLESLRLFVEKRPEEIGCLTFDKDDTLAVEFVTAAANLRAFSFGISMQSLFDAKGVAGNIVHAIATTNAIIAGLIVLESLKVLNDQTDACREVFCLEHPAKKKLIMSAELEMPNVNCYVCSKKPLTLEADAQHTTLGCVINKIVRKRLCVDSPMVFAGDRILYEVGDDLEESEVKMYEQNLKKRLCDFDPPISNGSALTVEDLQQDFKCNIFIKHREDFDEEREPDRLVLIGSGFASAETVAKKEVSESKVIGENGQHNVKPSEVSQATKASSETAPTRVGAEDSNCGDAQTCSGGVVVIEEDDDEVMEATTESMLGKRKREEGETERPPSPKAEEEVVEVLLSDTAARKASSMPGKGSEADPEIIDV